MVLRILILSLVVLGFSPVAMAQNAGSEVSEEVAKPDKPKPNKRVCRKVKPTGSHIPQRICMKQREWDEMTRVARERMGNSGQHNTSSGS